MKVLRNYLLKMGMLIFPGEISSVVAVVPSCVTYGGIPDERIPSWIFEGTPLSVAPTPIRKDDFKQLKTQKSVNLTKIFLEKMQNNKQAFDQAMIKVENIRCPILLISGKDDNMWPSSIYCDLIMQRLDAFNSPIFREHLPYENVGHMILNPYAPIRLMTKDFKHPITGLFYEVGGDQEAQFLACKDSWKKILHFFSRFSQRNF